MFSAVTSWLGGTKPEDEDTQPYEKKDDDVGQTEAKQDPDKVIEDQDQTSTNMTKGDKEEAYPLPPMPNMSEVSEKTLNAAKEWGGYLFNVGKAATEQVVKTAKQVKETVEEKTIIGDFAKEQDKFVTEKKDQKRLTEAAVAPWVGYNEEEEMKSQILALSQDKRNFMRNPPSGVQFQYDATASHPVAMAMLQEDENLKAMRFELVPKQIKEEVFWRNYFYRVSLIKQSTQLTSLAQQSGDESDAHDKKENAETSASQSKEKAEDEKELPLSSSSPPDNEFISDAFTESGISEDDLRAEMKQFGLSNKASSQPQDDIPEWEKELAAELQEYEVVDDGNALVDDADLENEILQQIEAEAEG